MSDGLSDYWAARLAEPRDVKWFQAPSGGWLPNRALSVEEYRLNPPPVDDRPIVPRRVTEHGRLMYADDLGLPEPSDAPYAFWLGREG